jgi:ABC-2 type transport system ATP-binding protein
MTLAPSLAESREAALLCRGLIKRYADVTAVDGLDLEIQRGECFGLLGPNGAGKTTTIEILEGLTRPDAGEVRVLGVTWGHGDDRGLRQRLGIQLQETKLQDKVSVLETLELFRSFYPRGPTPEAVMRRVALEEKRNAWVVKLSGGQRQRLSLACALVNDPELLFLDEPMSGLDPIGRRLVRDLILELRRAGKTVLFSTHILSDAEALCDRVAVLRGGRLLKVGALADLLRVDVTHMEVLASGVAAGAPGLDAASQVVRVGDRLRLEVEERSLGRVVVAVEAAGGRVLGVQPVRRSLEDYFFEEMGGAAARTGEWGEG